jgi:hypothetical protein
MKPENVIISSTDDALKLTDQRVIYENGEFYSSIPLQQVAGCELGVRRFPALLLIGAFLVTTAAFLAHSRAMEAAAINAIIGAVLMLLWWVLKPGLLIVHATSGHKIRIPTKGMKYQEVRRFAEAVSHQLMRTN